MADQWLSEIALAAALSSHSRLGARSLLSLVDTEILRMIIEQVREVDFTFFEIPLLLKTIHCYWLVSSAHFADEMKN